MCNNAAARVSFFLALAFAIGCGGGGGGAVKNTINTTYTVAGSSLAGADDGPVATATFNNPVNVAIDGDGTIYVCDFDNSLIRRISAGQVTTLVNQANFQRPFGIALGPAGQLYIQTDQNDLGERDGTTGTVWSVDKTTGAATVIARNLGRPRGLAVLPDGTIVMSNLTRNVISLLDPGTGVETVISGADGVAGDAEGAGANARFDRPYGCTVMADGAILVADQNNNKIKRVRTDGFTSLYAGSGTAGTQEGAVGTAQFNGPQDVKRSSSGEVFVADTLNRKIRKISGGVVSTLAGNGVRDYKDGAGQDASFVGLEGIAVWPNGAELIVADGNGGEGDAYHRIRTVNL